MVVDVVVDVVVDGAVDVDARTLSLTQTSTSTARSASTSTKGPFRTSLPRMEYRNLGGSGLRVSTLCLGAMTFGEADDKSFMHKAGSDVATSHALLDRAREAGINFVDTADVYGQDGLSERVLGDWFALGGGRREQTVLATKFRFAMGDGPNKSGAARYRIVRCVDDSLRRLRTDRIDLYQIHMQDIGTPEEEVVRALDDLVTAGKVVYLGASNYAAYRLVDSLWTARSQHRARFVTLQAQYNLLVRDLEREHVPLMQQFGLGLLPWSPLAAGFDDGRELDEVTAFVAGDLAIARAAIAALG